MRAEDRKQRPGARNEHRHLSCAGTIAESHPQIPSTKRGRCRERQHNQAPKVEFRGDRQTDDEKVAPRIWRRGSVVHLKQDRLSAQACCVDADPSGRPGFLPLCQRVVRQNRRVVGSDLKEVHDVQPGKSEQRRPIGLVPVRRSSGRRSGSQLNPTSCPCGSSVTVALPGISVGGSSSVTTWNRFFGKRREGLCR